MNTVQILRQYRRSPARADERLIAKLEAEARVFDAARWETRAYNVAAADTADLLQAAAKRLRELTNRMRGLE